MGERDTLTRVLAVVGTALAWFPILAPILLSAVVSIQRGVFLFDYLMPAELFLLVLIGGGLLIWAALRARSHLKLIAWGLGSAVFLLVGAQALAVVTGLASGETPPEGVWWVVVLAAIAGYWLAVITVGVGGLLLLRDLFRGSE